MMYREHDKRPDRPRAWPWLAAAVIFSLGVGLLSLRMASVLRNIDLGIRDTPPAIAPAGPTVVQLERLAYLVSSRVHVADVLVGESRWLQGSWIIQGDALIGVDMSKSEVVEKDEKARAATIVLPRPAVLSARVNHEKSQQWDIRSRSWIPVAGSLLGDRPAMEKQAMLEAQRLVERAASTEDFMASARQGVEGMLGEFYRGVGWRVAVRWK
jgi:hypothetical protein